jgi:hypothetical protein
VTIYRTLGVCFALVAAAPTGRAMPREPRDPMPRLATGAMRVPTGGIARSGRLYGGWKGARAFPLAATTIHYPKGGALV